MQICVGNFNCKDYHLMSLMLAYSTVDNEIEVCISHKKLK